MKDVGSVASFQMWYSLGASGQWGYCIRWPLRISLLCVCWYICKLLYMCLHAESRPALCNPVDDSLPGSSVHGILQVRVLEWVAISYSRGSSQPWDRTCISCIAGRLYLLTYRGSQALVCKKEIFKDFWKTERKKKKKTHWKLIFSWDGMGTILWISCFAVKGNCFRHIFTIGMIRSHDYWGICFAL